MRTYYAILYSIARLFFCLVHPVRAIGREHIPAGGVLVCANHTGLSDPLLVAFAATRHHQLRVMAKAELMRVPVLGFLLKKAGIFGVERGKSDIGAIKQAMRYLKEGEKVLLFPQGTRVREGEEGEAKTGAAMLAVRTGVPILPVYVPEKKKWFRCTTVVIGQAYYPVTAGKRATAEEYKTIAEDLMERISKLGEQA